MNKSYIIVSDIHLGSIRCNHGEFCHFLEWMKGLSNKPETIKCNNLEMKMESPSEIILLGDILELWDPRKGDRNNIIKDCLRPLDLLSAIDCNKIYVIGNHDDSLCELDGVVDEEVLDNGSRFFIHKRHYPEKDECGNINGLKIGEVSYSFIHGHQFNRAQVYVGRIIKYWNPLAWFQAAFNIPFSKKYLKVNLVIFVALLLLGKYVLWNAFLDAHFTATLVWAMATYFFAISSISGVVANSQRILYDLTKPADKTAEQVVTNRYYRKIKETVNADVIVFGHTHFASSYKLESENKLFLNSGCWFDTDTNFNGKMRYTNTFIYIDDTGAYIMRWLGNGKIECIEAHIQKK